MAGRRSKKKPDDEKIKEVEDATVHLPAMTTKKLPNNRDNLTSEDALALLRDIDTFDQLRDIEQRFLISYSMLGNVSRAAKAANVSMATHALWMKTRPLYPEVFKQAHEIATDYLEAEAVRRAKDGVTVRKFHPKTGEEYFEQVYSDRLLEFLLKGHRRRVFGDTNKVEMSGKMQQEISGPDGKPIEIKNPEINWEVMPLELKMQLLEFIEHQEQQEVIDGTVEQSQIGHE